MTHLKLYLDDVRPAPEGWFLEKSVSEAIDTIKIFLMGKGERTFEVSLDFDLGMIGAHCYTCGNKGWGRPVGHPDYCPDCTHIIVEHDEAAPTGVELIYWFQKTGIMPTDIKLHTANPVGRKAMEWAIRDLYRDH